MILVKGIMEEYKDYRIKIWCFDTEVYNEDDRADDGRDITEYEIKGGGGKNQFMANWKYMKENDILIKNLSCLLMVMHGAVGAMKITVILYL